jgi:ribosome-associated protein
VTADRPGRISRVSVVREVPIRDESIRLGQFLKLSDLIDNGADAKPLLMQGLVFVNGELETRRGRQLVKGDVVSVGDEAVRVG